MRDVFSSLQLESCEIVLVGDGSGTTSSSPYGWCVLAFTRSGDVTRITRGGSGGTNNHAELEPYVYALQFVHNNKMGRKIGIISDSEVTVRCGNGQYERRANAALWAAIEWFERNGYEIVWRHVPRNSNPASSYADKVAGMVRKAIGGECVEPLPLALCGELG